MITRFDDNRMSEATLIKDGIAPSTGPRLLLISYHFPPGQATGALRWQQLSRFAVERGWSIDVITRHPDELPSADFGRLSQLPDAVRVYGVRSEVDAIRRWEQRLVRWRNKLRSSRTPALPNARTSVPSSAAEPKGSELTWRRDLEWSLSPRGFRRAYDAWRFFQEEWSWARAAQREAIALFRGHDAIVSCGPPHLPHVAARNAARHHGVPYIMDLRDPWSLTPAVPNALATPLWYRLAEGYESTTMRGAALVVANTGLHASELRKLYPDAADHIMAVMNGCDDDRVEPQPSDRFLISYAGNIYIDRDPRFLFRAAARFLREERLTPAQAGIELIGHVDQFGGVPVKVLAEQEGLAEFVDVHPRLPRGDALKLMARAAVLVSLPQEVDLAVPSKVFEYTQFPAWLLALARTGSATEEVLRGSGADIVSPDDEAAIVAVLRQRWRQFQASGRPQPINADGRFNRTRQAAILFDAIEQKLGGAKQRLAERAA
jgi:glycosyltransferase involved in cell wall biosynthesis